MNFSAPRARGFDVSNLVVRHREIVLPARIAGVGFREALKLSLSDIRQMDAGRTDNLPRSEVSDKPKPLRQTVDDSGKSRHSAERQKL
jgi:hypothetical protein